MPYMTLIHMSPPASFTWPSFTCHDLPHSHVTTWQPKVPGKLREIIQVAHAWCLATCLISAVCNLYLTRCTRQDTPCTRLISYTLHQHCIPQSGRETTRINKGCGQTRGFNLGRGKIVSLERGGTRPEGIWRYRRPHHLVVVLLLLYVSVHVTWLIHRCANDM